MGKAKDSSKMKKKLTGLEEYSMHRTGGEKWLYSEFVSTQIGFSNYKVFGKSNK